MTCWKLIIGYYDTLMAGLHQVMELEMGIILPVIDVAIFIYFFPSHYVDFYLSISKLLSKSQGVLLFLKIDRNEPNFLSSQSYNFGYSQ